MRKSLTVVQHHPAEGAGELGAWAGRRGVELEIHRADLGDLPGTTARPCVLLGGPYSVNDAPEWLETERAWLRGRITDGSPVLGICLGSQLLADASGAHVIKLARPEHGWTRIDFAAGFNVGCSHLDVLQWHEEGFTLPPGAESLASSQACQHQMFRIGSRLVGIQFHPEWNAASIQTLNDWFGVGSPLPRDTDSDAKRLRLISAWLHEQMDAWWAGV